MDGLPEGVTSQGLKIPAGQSRGLLLLTASVDAPRSAANARISGRATIDGNPVTRPCQLASMAWPIPDSWGEIPSPRLLADVPVSVSGVDQAPITIAPSGGKTYEVTAGEKLTVPYALTRRSEFQGASTQLRAIGAGLESVPALEINLAGDRAEAVIDTAALKTPPGDYVLAFQGSAVAMYRHHPEAILLAEADKRKAEQAVTAIEAEVRQATEAAASATAEQKADLDKALAQATARQSAAAAALAAAVEQFNRATAAAQPRDIVDIVLAEPISIRVKATESQ
jgi:hypothetical protein